jgi:hypothetical protein
MMIKVKRIQTLLFFLLQVAIFFPSCNKDEGYSALRGDEAEIEMTFTQPTTYAPEDGTADERAIHSLDLLVFQRQANGNADDALFVEKRYARQVGTTSKYRSFIRIGDDLDIYFAANVRSLLDGLETSSGLVAGETTYAQAREKLVLLTPANLATNLSTNGLPMWGYLYDQTIADQTYTDLGIIKLLRAVASADISVSANNFILQKGHLVFSANKGYLPFSHGNLDNSYNVKTPEVPTDMTANVDLLHAITPSPALPPAPAPASPQEIKNEFYLYENDAPAENGRRSSKVILEGVYTGSGGSGNTTFYPLAFRDAGNQKLQVKRNWKYVLVVTKVNGDGYSTIDEAKEGEDLNMDYKVIQWNGNEDDNIQIIGSKYVANYAKAVELYRPATSGKEFVVRTNFNLDDFELELDNGGALLDPDDKTEIQNERFNVKITAGTGSEEVLFTVTARLDYDPAATDNPSILTVTVGGVIVFHTTITQTNETPFDWNDGGNQNTGLGEP